MMEKDVLEVCESLRDLVRLAVMLSSLRYTPGALAAISKSSECFNYFMAKNSYVYWWNGAN